MTMKKYTLDEKLDEVEIAKHNSDMENLANAIKYAHMGIDEARREIVRLEVLIDEITTFAAALERQDSAHEPPVEVIRRFYDRARHSVKGSR